MRGHFDSESKMWKSQKLKGDQNAKNKKPNTKSTNSLNN
jgi:hypothetical protein